MVVCIISSNPVGVIFELFEKSGIDVLVFVFKFVEVEFELGRKAIVCL
jgi:hypothetical protein